MPPPLYATQLPTLLDRGEDFSTYADARSNAKLRLRLRRFLAAMQEVPSETLAIIAREVRLPVGEVLASPFSVIIAGHAADHGVESVHLEARTTIEWARDLRPSHPSLVYEKSRWQRGVLHTSKYASFCQDEPMAVYNPNHISKWGVHELLHRVVGFFFRPDFTPFELYLGSRLNELLPVATWYGLEQTARLREAKFSAEQAQSQPNAEVRDAIWRRIPLSKLYEFAGEYIAQLQFFFAHTERELAAIARETKSGCIERVSHPEEPHLHASSDALAYVLAHQQRLQNPRVSDCLARWGAASRYESISRYSRRIAQVRRALVMPTEALTKDPSAHRRQARRSWDIALRAAHHSPRAYELCCRHGPTHARMPQAVRDDGLTHFAAATFAAGVATFADHVELNPVLQDKLNAELALETTQATRFSRTPLAQRAAGVLSTLSAAHAEILRFHNALADAEQLRDDAQWLSGAISKRSKYVRSDAYRAHSFSVDPLEHGVVRETHLLIGRSRDGDIQVIPIDATTLRWWNSLPSSLKANSEAHAKNAIRRVAKARVVETLINVDAIRAYSAV